MSRWLSLALLVGCVGCEDTLGCTLADCLDMLSIAARTADGMPLPAGRYEIELLLDGTRVACQASIPEEAPFVCDAADVSLYSIKPRITSLDAAPPESTGLEVQTTRTPRAVDAVVRHEGREVARASFEPMYTKFAPNGVECGPVCSNARSPLPLTF